MMKREQIVTVAVTLAAVSAPPLIVLLVSALLFSESVLPDFVANPIASDASIAIFSDITKLMMSMATGIGLTSVWFFRQPKRAGLGGLVVIIFVTSMVLTLISLYAGLRFLFDMAMQLQYTKFKILLLRGRLWVQGTSLLLLASLLCANAVLHHFVRDRRYSEAGDKK